MSEVGKKKPESGDLRARAARNAHCVIGAHVLDLVGNKTALSIESLVASLEAAVSESDSAIGNCAREDDLDRLTAEEAIIAISMEQAS